MNGKSKTAIPAMWLIILIAGLIQLSETVYSPSLPDIAVALTTSDSLVEYTLTIFLFSFALGVLFWGRISDKLGRKPCVIAGLVVYLIGCILCYYAPTIEILMLSRFIQAFGGSIGSVLMQAICRDAFHGAALGRAYSTVGSALGAFPAIGPIIGGFIAEYLGWRGVFLFLTIFGALITILAMIMLPETHHRDVRQKISLKEVALKMLQDEKVRIYGFLVAICNGLTFSYYAEGSFYLVEMLGVSPVEYGISFAPIAAGMILGGVYSRWLNQHMAVHHIILRGLCISLVSNILFAGIVIFSCIFLIPKEVLTVTTIVSFMAMSFGVCMVTTNSLAQALVEYKWCIGSASSLFGFSYYIVISLVTFGMGALHNDTLLPMPLYFLVLNILMLGAYRKLRH
jgi:MFS transporter, DHA1 family, multidrug resistance protein